MSDTPTYASLLTRLFSGSPEDRAAVIRHLEADAADRVAAGPEVRARLRDTFPWLRLVAAEAVFRVYGDTAAAVDAVAGVLRSGDPAVIADAVALARQFGPAAAPLLETIVWHARDVFAGQSPEYHRWAAEVAVRSGPDGLGVWLDMVITDRTDVGAMMGLAAAAPAVGYDLSRAEERVRHFLGHWRGVRIAAGAALWRVTWRVNRGWLAAIDPVCTDMNTPGLRGLVIEVLLEHLGRRPDLAGLVRGLLSALAADDPNAAEEAVGRVARLGSRGWGVLVPMLHPPRPDAVRETIFRLAADRPAVLPLVHHHAHGVIAAAAAEATASDLIPLAARVLRKLGPAAGMAVPDLLNLAVRVPSAAPVVALTLPRIAAGFPNTAAAVVRTLHRVRTSSYFGPDQQGAFQALAKALGELDPEAGPALVGDTAIDPRVAEQLLQEPAWKDAPHETRVRHARVLADGLASSRAEVRIRAAELLRHYRPELTAVWPALVAALAGPDEKTALAVLQHFRHLEPVADVVTTDLLALFREKNPDYAARAVVALWRLGRMPAVGHDLRAAVEAAPEDGWGWAVLRGVVSRVAQAHGLLNDLNELFAASPAAVAEKVAALVNPPESPEEAQIGRLVPRPGDPTAPEHVDWDAAHQAVSGEGAAGALLFVALMAEYGSAGFRNQKIWMIKNHRELTRVGLAESKGIVERVMAAFERPGATSGERRQAVRDYFAGRVELPPEVVGMLEHRLGWVRWAGLELADAWGLTPEQAKGLTGDRVWDTSPRVRERALRMVRG